MNTTTIPTPLSISRTARHLCVQQSLLRAWEARYGWPRPRRNRSGFRVYSPAQVTEIARVLAYVKAGTPISQLIADGMVILPATAPKPSPVQFDAATIPCPLGADARDVRDRLILGLIQRHPGIVRWAAQQCARLHPRDRGPAVLQILNAYRQQVAESAWLNPILEN